MSRVAAKRRRHHPGAPARRRAAPERRPGPLDRAEQVEVGAALAAAHHVIECGEPRLLRPLAPHQRGDAPRATDASRAGPPAAGLRRWRIGLSQTILAHDASSACSHPTPISVSRSRRSASPRYSRFRVLPSVQPIS